jgi:hypothetical protein
MPYPRYFDMQDIFYQDNDERYYYAMDFKTPDFLADGDTISGTPIVTSEIRGGLTSDLVIEEVSTSGLYVFMWISSGTPHQTYKVEVRADTANGAKVEGDGFLRIGD